MPDAHADASTDVIVIGGGVAGLLAALHHARAGRHTVLLEAEPVVGGCVRSHRVAGLTLDRGAESFATARPAVAALVAELGLPTEPPVGHPAWLFHRGGAAPIPAATLLGIPAHPAAPDVRRVIGWPGVLRAGLDRILPVGAAAAGVGTGLGELVARRLGPRVLDRLVAPVVAGVYSADPVGLDTAAVAPGLLDAMRATGSLTGAVRKLRGHGPAAGSAVAGITGGMWLLADALAAALTDAGARIRTGCAVRDLRPRGAGWVVTVSPAGGGPAGGAIARSATADGLAPGSPSYPVETLEAGSAVIAVPAAQAAHLLGRATDGAVRLPVPPPTPVAIVTLVVDEPELDAAPRGTGLLVAPDVTEVAAKALTHSTAKWGFVARAAGEHRHVLRLSYGRGGALPADGEFPDLALRDAGTLLGVRLDGRSLVDHDLVRYSNQLAARRADERAAVERIPLQLQDFPGLAVCGSAIAGTGLGAVVAQTTGTVSGDGPPLKAGSNHDHH